jgi:hypothetical protein
LIQQLPLNSEKWCREDLRLKLLSFFFGITSALLVIFSFQNCGGPTRNHNIPKQDILTKMDGAVLDQESVLTASLVDQIETQSRNSTQVTNSDASSFKQLAQTCFQQFEQRLQADCLSTLVAQYYSLLKRLNYEIVQGDRCWLASKRNIETGLARVSSTCFSSVGHDKDNPGLSLGSCVDFANSGDSEFAAITYFRNSATFSHLDLLVPYPDTDPRRIEVLFSGETGTIIQDACGNGHKITGYDANFIY